MMRYTVLQFESQVLAWLTTINTLFSNLSVMYGMCVYMFYVRLCHSSVCVCVRLFWNVVTVVCTLLLVKLVILVFVIYSALRIESVYAKYQRTVK